MSHDHCTLWPDGTWGHCCERHDLTYWATSNLSPFDPDRWHLRWLADWHLYRCVRAEGRPVTAAVMLAGVLVLGPLYGATKFRWRNL